VSLIPPFQAPAHTIRNTIEELCSVTTQYTTSNEAAQLRPAPSNSEEASSDVAIQDAGRVPRVARRGVSTIFRRSQQRPTMMVAMARKWAALVFLTTSSLGDGITAAAGSNKCHVWPPTDHFEKLLEETCLKHTYPIKRKLRDYGTMKNFMDS
jgi:hypothetical protein